MFGSSAAMHAPGADTLRATAAAQRAAALQRAALRDRWRSKFFLMRALAAPRPAHQKPHRRSDYIKRISCTQFAPSMRAPAIGLSFQKRPAPHLSLPSSLGASFQPVSSPTRSPTAEATFQAPVHAIRSVFWGGWIEERALQFCFLFCSLTHQPINAGQANNKRKMYNSIILDDGVRYAYKIALKNRGGGVE